MRSYEISPSRRFSVNYRGYTVRCDPVIGNGPMMTCRRCFKNCDVWIIRVLSPRLQYYLMSTTGFYYSDYSFLYPLSRGTIFFNDAPWTYISSRNTFSLAPSGKWWKFFQWFQWFHFFCFVINFALRGWRLQLPNPSRVGMLRCLARPRWPKTRNWHPSRH
ncbi:hypothetical protein B0O99DRAFT_623306 [Bisporella sp. PMI_857]|nr:hypothetical protein B0O99DRAFT_623306 [Bisporella sp. PMI_857]